MSDTQPQHSPYWDLEKTNAEEHNQIVMELEAALAESQTYAEALAKALKTAKRCARGLGSVWQSEATQALADWKARQE